MEEQQSATDRRLPWLQLLLAILSIVVVFTLALDSALNFPPEVSRIVQVLDLSACIIFFIDLCVRFGRAPSKGEFMKWGWVDLLACIPNVDFLRIGRLVRVLRFIQLFRGVRVSIRLMAVLLAGRPRNALSSVLFTVLLLVSFSSIGILICERAPDANIHTAEDAVWWSVTTITTVGYGDKFPVTTEGRILAMFLMISGVGLFGILSGVVASLFLSTSAESHADSASIVRELRQLRLQIEELKRK